MKGIIIALFAIVACVVAGEGERDSSGPPCPSDNSIDVLLPDRNCNRFWQCSNGVAIQRRCPRGLNFSFRLRVCDWPRRARCTGEGWQGLELCIREPWRPACRKRSENYEVDEYDYLDEDLE